MKFKAKYKPELSVCHDPSRSHIAAVHFDVDKSVLVATNGHMLVKVPCEPQPGEKTGPISPEALRGARTEARKNRYNKAKATPRIRVAKKLLDTGGAIYRRPETGAFPPYEQVMPTFKAGDKGTFTFGVNPRYLLAALQAMGCDGYSRLLRVTVKISQEALEPILVEPGDEVDRVDGAIAVVMPGRV